ARVSTARFELELGDASVRVEPAAVRVRRGTVRVVERAGGQASQVSAGGGWPAPATAGSTRATRSAAELLATARSEFAAKRYPAAAQTTQRALASGPTRRERAEAHTLLAELAQATGDLERAIERYQAVATTFSELPAAESALYAAARLEIRRGRRAGARALLSRYLDHYPTGRYAADARREIARIE
ncbi:MAG: tetratricopeptide repeat protein, partial [Kofleriaceae bacterium]